MSKMNLPKNASYSLCLLFLFFVLCGTQGPSYSVKGQPDKKRLKCYTCDSRVDPKCGEDWMVDNPDKYKMVCNETQHTCRKFVVKMIENYPTVVTRGCHDAGMVKSKPYMPNECRDDENGILYSCYCTMDLCNGQDKNVVSFFTIPFFVVLTVAACDIFV